MEDKIFDTDFLKKLDSIALNANITMSEGSSGSRKSKSKGSSVEFSDYREYTAGDDFRRVDWNAYGRFDRLFVKLFMEEREALINIFIDSSKSMNYGNPKKSTMCLKLSAVFSFLALNNLDRVCINELKDNTVKQSTAVTGRTMFPRCLNTLQNINFDKITDLNACMKRKDIRGRGISIVISDFFMKGSIEETIKYLKYKNQEVVLIHILCPEELNPEIQGQVRLIDSETKEARNIIVTSNLLRQYEKHLNMFIASIKELANRFGVYYVQVSSSDEIEKIIFEQFTKAGIIA